MYVGGWVVPQISVKHLLTLPSLHTGCGWAFSSPSLAVLPLSSILWEKSCRQSLYTTLTRVSGAARSCCRSGNGPISSPPCCSLVWINNWTIINNQELNHGAKHALCFTACNLPGTKRGGEMFVVLPCSSEPLCPPGLVLPRGARRGPCRWPRDGGRVLERGTVPWSGVRRRK